MANYNIQKGLDIPISGEPEQKIYQGPAITSVALIGKDYPGLKPSMQVSEGDTVKLGQTLFVDKRDPRIRYTSPGGGVVEQINRGHRRVLDSIVIRLHGNKESEQFDQFTADKLDRLDRSQIQDTLLRSGLWTALRTRPYSKVPLPDTSPSSLFVNAMTSDPLALDVDVVLKGEEENFINGLKVISKLTDGTTHLCSSPNSRIPGNDLPKTKKTTFSGPHPAGLTGTHIHFIDPIHEDKVVWYIGFQDVIAIGILFVSGQHPVNRIISLCGPATRQPRLLRTHLGANVEELTHAECNQPDCRAISGSVLSGNTARGNFSWLGRYHQQLTLLNEGRQREFLGWLIPHTALFSFTGSRWAKLFKKNRAYNMNTNQHGSRRAMVPFGTYEEVMPLELLPTQLLKALLIRDTDAAVSLGALELDEEDLALCTFICHSKMEYGAILRDCLSIIEKEG